MTDINHLHVLALLIVLAAVAMGLLSLWAVSSRFSLYVRTVILAVPLGCVVAIPAYEPFVFLFVQCLVILAGMQAWQWRTSRQHSTSRSTLWSTRFSLKSLLFFTVIAAALIALAVRLPRHSAYVWFDLLLAASAAGICTLLGVWLTFSERGRWWRVPAAILVAFLLAVPLVFMDGFLISFPDLTNDWALYVAMGLDAIYATRWFAVLPSVLLVTTVWLVLALASGRIAGSKQNEGKNRRPAIKLLAPAGLLSLTLLLVVPLVVIYFEMLSRPTIPQPTVPSPNGYDDIVAAQALMVKSNVLEEPDAATASSLARELAKNESALRRLRVGLSKPCERHVDYTSEESLALDQIGAFRSLARALVAEGRLAVHEERYADAADSYLDVVRLSHCVDRGSLLIDWLVGRAIESTGMYGIISIRGKLDEEHSDALVRELRVFETNREPYEKAIKRDIVWVKSALGWRGRLDHLLHAVFYGRFPSSRQIEIAGLRSQTVSRLTIVELALQKFQRRHGFLPERLEEVIPAGDWVTQDPFAPDDAKNFVYARTNDGHVLYSLGYDGDDDGGRTAEGVWVEDGDVTLDSLIQDDSPSGDAGESEEMAE